MATDRTHLWAFYIFAVELVVAWAVSKAIHQGDLLGVLALMVAFIAGLLFLIYLRAEDLRRNAWCEARR